MTRAVLLLALLEGVASAQGYGRHSESSEIGFVSVAYGWNSQGKDVWKDAGHGHDDGVKACFDQAFPPAGRKPFETIYVRVDVPNPDVDSQKAGFSHRLQGGGLYYEKGTHPEYEACLTKEIGPVHAPPDVWSVEVFVTVNSKAVRGVMGHGGGGSP
jgi:hypothetical protein